LATAKPITTLVAGLGRIGWKYHIAEAAKNPHFHVTAAVDPLPERRHEAGEKYGCPTFATLEHALDARLAELAVICTPSIYHCRHTLSALKAGCHVFLEKPAAMNAREFGRMIAAARRARRILTVNQSCRMLPEPRFVRQTIDSGLLGEVFWIRLSGLSFTRRNDWQMVRRFGGGLLYNGGSHHIDTALRLLDGPVHDVWGDIKHTVGAGDADDHVKICIRSTKGRLFELEMSYACAIPQPSWLVCGTAGTMQIADGKAAIKYFDPRRAPAVKLITSAPAGRRYGNDDRLPWKEKTVKAVPKKAYPDIYDSLYRSVRKHSPLLVTPQSVLQAMKVMDAVRRSSLWKG